MVLGTGGTSLWERHWSRYAESPRAMRAMRFVADICKDANASITTLTLHHHRIAREGIERQGQHNPLQPFVERWPQNWDALYRQLATYCQDGLDLGRHLAYLALMTNDAPLLAQARSLIEFAPRRLRSLIDPDADISLLNAIANTAALWALSADDPPPRRPQDRRLHLPAPAGVPPR